MKVILNQTVPKVGKQGDVVTVADGYARNFLFPRGLAIVAEKKQLEALNRRNERTAAKSADDKALAEKIREKLDGKQIRIQGKVGRDGGKLFGAITAQDVADMLKTETGVTIEKRQIGLVQPIKRLGKFTVPIDLHREVDATVTVEVFDPEAPVVAEVQAEEESEAEPATV